MQSTVYKRQRQCTLVTWNKTVLSVSLRHSVAMLTALTYWRPAGELTLLIYETGTPRRRIQVQRHLAARRVNRGAPTHHMLCCSERKMSSLQRLAVVEPPGMRSRARLWRHFRFRHIPLSHRRRNIGLPDLQFERTQSINVHNRKTAIFISRPAIMRRSYRDVALRIASRLAACLSVTCLTLTEEKKFLKCKPVVCYSDRCGYIPVDLSMPYPCHEDAEADFRRKKVKSLVKMYWRLTLWNIAKSCHTFACSLIVCQFVCQKLT